MEVILTKPVENLGARGTIVRVADGYARNYLLPKGYAIEATKGARKQAEAMQRSEQRREQQRRDAAGLERDRLHGKAVTVRARTTAQGKLYGSVTGREVCEALRETHGITVDLDRCQLEEHLRTTGTFSVPFHIYKDITAEVTVTVKGIEGEPEAGETADAAPAEDVQRAPKPKPIITDAAQEA